MSILLCNYTKTDGTSCGSPALRGKKICFFHQRHRKRREYSAKIARELDVLGPRLPRMRNLSEVQAALFEIITAVAEQRIDLDRAGSHLYHLDRISQALRAPRKA